MKYETLIKELFGEKIGAYAGKSAVGVHDERSEAGVCSACGLMPVGGSCGCDDHMEEDDSMCPECGMEMLGGSCGCSHEAEECAECGMMPVQGECGCSMNEGDGSCDECGMTEGMCECGMNEGKKKRTGPSKSTAKKILKGAVTATQKAHKVDSWAKNPWAAANWMSQKAGVALHGKKKD